MMISSTAPNEIPTGLGALGGIVTCDMVVNSSGNAVDCSKWSNLFNGACWNPLSPCAAAGSVDGQPTQADMSQSQLGTVVASVTESQPGQDACSPVIGISCTVLALGAAAMLAAFLYFKK